MGAGPVYKHENRHFSFNQAKSLITNHLGVVPAQVLDAQALMVDRAGLEPAYYSAVTPFVDAYIGPTII